jgi:hypothetical protein
MERKDFLLTEEQYARLKEAGRPVPYLVANGTEPTSPQDRVNAIWQEYGREMGFVWDTAGPIVGKDWRHFAAYVMEKASDEENRNDPDVQG